MISAENQHKSQPISVRNSTEYSYDFSPVWVKLSRVGRKNLQWIVVGSACVSTQYAHAFYFIKSKALSNADMTREYSDQAACMHMLIRIFVIQIPYTVELQWLEH